MVEGFPFRIRLRNPPRGGYAAIALPDCPHSCLAEERRRLPSHRGQADREAGAQNSRGAVRARRYAEAVLRPDSPAMCVDDLLRNRKAQPGILAEALVRPV